MASIVRRIQNKQLANLPPWLPNNTVYECIMGSMAYGVSTDNSDMDIYGFCLPKKEMIFPHLAGEIFGFGKQIQRFEQWQQHHIEDKEADKQYDCVIYSIVKYFQLCMENNPNMIDSLFVPDNCVLHISTIGQMVREKRKIFLSRAVKHKMVGYAFSCLHKEENKEHKWLNEVWAFEEKHLIDHSITFASVLSEMKKRGLECKEEK